MATSLPKDWKDMLALLALPADEQIKGQKGMGVYTHPLGLKASYKKFSTGTDGVVDEFREHRFNGLRYGRNVRVRPQYPRRKGLMSIGASFVTDSEVLVRCHTPEFRTENLDLVEGPPEVERALRELEGAHRWKRTTIDSDGERIRVHRKMRMLTRGQFDWTYDLWLAEQLADKLAGST